MIETTEHFSATWRKQNGVAPDGPVCAIDTEADSLHRYRESLCLVQFAVRGESVLIDPLAIEDLSPLGRTCGSHRLDARRGL
jgi:ribonuclease D